MLRLASLRFGRALSSAASPSGLKVTERCASRLGHLVETRGHPVVLRVSVDGGGCSGFQYAFSIENKLDEAEDVSAKKDAPSGPADLVFEEHGAEVRVDPISYAFVKGSTVDYVEELISSSFRITDNPNAEQGCGCGVSFAAK